MTLLYCSRCVMTYSFKDLQCDNSLPLEEQTYNCIKCGEQGSPIYRVVLLVKDDSTSGTDKCYKLHYYSHDQEPGMELFGGLSPTNLYKDEKSRFYLSKYLQLLTRFNIYMDLIIKKRFANQINEDVYQVLDGKMQTLSFPLEENMIIN